MRLLKSSCALALVIAPLAAVAQPDAQSVPKPTAVPEAPGAPEPGVPPAVPAEATDWEGEVSREWEVGISVLGFVNGSFMTELSDSDKLRTTPNGGKRLTLYPGFGGVGGGGGLTVSGMWRGIVGLELGFFYSLDQGSGDLTLGAAKIDFTLSQEAFHLPIVLKVAAPVKPVRPFVFFGPEFVFPGEPDAETDSGLIQLVEPIAATADNYLTLAFGLGFEFMLPVEGADVRIPLVLRGAWNPSAGDTIDDRIDVDGCGADDICTFKTEWEWQTEVALGVAYYFL